MRSVIELHTVDSLLAATVLAGGGLVAFVSWRRRVERRQRMLREAGYRLIHELKAYLAWIEMLRGEPYTSTEPEQLTAAQALREARTIAQSSFPDLEQSMLRLLQGDARLMGYLWEHKLLRLSDPGQWVPYDRDQAYWMLRDGQEDLVEEIIARCRVLTGEDARSWHGTDLDSEFFSTRGLSTNPL